jgi:hypothetical protein
MALVQQVKGIHPAKIPTVEKGVTRPQDMPACVDCFRPVQGAAVAGYDGKWRCLACNRIHGEAVLLESGESAPNASEERPGRIIGHDETAETKRKKRASAMIEKYGIRKVS